MFLFLFTVCLTNLIMKMMRMMMGTCNVAIYIVGYEKVFKIKLDGLLGE